MVEFKDESRKQDCLMGRTSRPLFGGTWCVSGCSWGPLFSDTVFMMTSGNNKLMAFWAVNKGFWVIIHIRLVSTS